MTTTATKNTKLKQTYQFDGLPYTDKEMAIYRLILSAGGVVTTTDVIKAIYRGERYRNVRIIAAATLNNLKYKLDLNGHPVGLAKSSRRGPVSIDWKLVPRSSGETTRAVRRARAARRR